MTESSPGVRRLCVCVGTRHPGILDGACRSGAARWLYLERFPAEHLEMGFATPGVDEAELVTGLISGLRTAARASAVPVLAAFHVGITRVQGDDLSGAAVSRVRGLLADLTGVPADGSAGGVLAVGISDSLFSDIGPDCGFAAGWAPLAGASAWFRVFQPAA